MLICLFLYRYKTVNFNCFNNQHLNQHHQSHYFANNFDALAKHLASCFWCISNWYIDEQLVTTTTRQVHPPTETLYLMYQMCQMSTTYNSTTTTYTSITVSLIMIYWLYNVYTWIIDYLFTIYNWIVSNWKNIIAIRHHFSNMRNCEFLDDHYDLWLIWLWFCYTK